MGWFAEIFGEKRQGGAFALSGSQLSAFNYGQGAVGWAADGSAQTTQQMIDLGKGRDDGDVIFSRMDSQPKIAQAQLMGLDIALYFVAALLLPNMTKVVLIDVRAGIAKCLTGARFGRDFGQAMDSLVDQYVKVLLNEIETVGEDKGLDLDAGPTAALVYKNVTEGYEQSSRFSTRSKLNVNAVDSMQIQFLVKAIMSARLNALKQMNLQFIP